MIPPTSWLNHLRSLPVLIPLNAGAEAGLLDLIKEIQYDARCAALEDIEQYVKKQQLKVPVCEA